MVTEVAQLRKVLNSPLPSKADRLIVAFSSRKKWTPETAQAQSQQIREQLRQRKLDRCRVIVAAPITGETVMDYLNTPDIDGGLLVDGNFDQTTEILSQILLQS